MVVIECVLYERKLQQLVIALKLRFIIYFIIRKNIANSKCVKWKYFDHNKRDEKNQMKIFLSVCQCVYCSMR